MGALGVFASYQCEVVHVPTDSEGLNPAGLSEAIDRVRAEGKTPKLIYTVPTYHNPLGITQPPQRRAEILQVAKSAGLLLLEDDPTACLVLMARFRAPSGPMMLMPLCTSGHSRRRSQPDCGSAGH